MRLFSVKRADYTMRAEMKIIGADILISVTGGDVPHIGTVTVWSKNEKIETIQFPSHSGRRHKDDLLAKIILEIISAALPGNCVITAGVHVDHISKVQILAASAMAEDLGNQIFQWLQENTMEADKPIYYKNDEQPR